MIITVISVSKNFLQWLITLYMKRNIINSVTISWFKRMHNKVEYDSRNKWLIDYILEYVSSQNINSQNMSCRINTELMKMRSVDVNDFVKFKFGVDAKHIEIPDYTISPAMLDGIYQASEDESDFYQSLQEFINVSV